MRSSLALLFVLALAACSGSNEDQSQQPVDQRTRDSAVANSGLPGASGVQGAMSAADSAAARNARLDSIAN